MREIHEADASQRKRALSFRNIHHESDERDVSETLKSRRRKERPSRDLGLPRDLRSQGSRFEHLLGLRFRQHALTSDSIRDILHQIPSQEIPASSNADTLQGCRSQNLRRYVREQSRSYA